MTQMTGENLWPGQQPGEGDAGGAAAYAELSVRSNFTFLEGASHPDELVTTAKALGLAAIGIADRNSLAGVVRAHVAAKEQNMRLLVGARLAPRDGPEVICYPQDRAAYGRLSRLLTLGKRRSEKGSCDFSFDELLAAGEGQIFILLPYDYEDQPDSEGALLDGTPLDRPAWDLEVRAGQLQAAHPGRSYLGLSQLYRGDDIRRLVAWSALAERIGLLTVALGEVIMHHPGRKAVADVLTAIRHHCTIDEVGWRLLANGEQHLKAPAEVARLFRADPQAVARSLEIVERCTFSLEELRYEYPRELGQDGRSPQEELILQTWKGAANRYPLGVPDKVRKTLEYELELIGQLGYAPYFLSVHDLVVFARSRDILCQGRGSAANSAVCYCLGVTAVDPARAELLFERFISPERREPPDIDVDFEHERREEVIQHIYARYGRDRAGMTATVISYRSKGALRDVGKAMGLSEDSINALSQKLRGWSRDELKEGLVNELGLDPGEPRLNLTLQLVSEIYGFPRHLSQHVGGFVMTEGPLCELVPIENAAMEDRTVIEWDKDDLDALGILKVDVLALGMLTCLAKSFDLLRRHYGRVLTLADIPAEDPKVYDMVCKADTIGVFQIESRAQMSMLPRLKPRNFYDLVIEVAIVRPGPIQGDMVHPYLRRRDGKEPVFYPSKELEEVLGRTLGVPLFQEQAMSIAIVAAGFTPPEADQLRRAMATFKRNGNLHLFGEKLVNGMLERGYERDFAERCFKQIQGFGTYGFPESHAASFALLVYVSSWMKCHYPEVFTCCLLNSQPMGFYAPAQLVRDLRDHGGQVLPVDINHSQWDNSLEFPRLARDLQPGDPLPAPQMALRLGFRQVKGLRQEEMEKLVAHRGNGYSDVLGLWRRGALRRQSLEALARADAYGSLGLDRRQALWAIKGLPDDAPLPLFAAMGEEDRGADPPVRLPRLKLSQQVVEDYASLRLSLKAHPLAFLREDLTAVGCQPARILQTARDGEYLAVAGLVLVRQRPGSAKGVIFVTLEDETGIANLVVWPKAFEAYRKEVLGSSLLGAYGKVQRAGLVVHLVVERLVDLSEDLRALEEEPRNLPEGAQVSDHEVAVPEASARDIPGQGKAGQEDAGREAPSSLPRETAEQRHLKQAGKDQVMRRLPKPAAGAVQATEEKLMPSRRRSPRRLARRNPLFRSRDFH
ncbi:error-prone DNA polymerase [Rhodovibrionaceae bacterium A322]